MDRYTLQLRELRKLPSGYLAKMVRDMKRNEATNINRSKRKQIAYITGRRYGS